MAEPNEDQSAASGFQADLTGEELIAAAIKSRDGALTTYTETGATLAFVAAASGDIAIPLDGKVYSLAITGNCDLVTGAVPTAPECGSAIVYVLIDTATPPVITVPATWNWPGKTVTAIPTANGARAELLLNSTPQGWIIARVTTIGVPV